MPRVKVFFIASANNNQELFGQIVGGHKMNNILKTTFLLSLLTMLLVAMGGAVGGKGGMIVAFLMAAVMNFGSYWFSDKIVLRMYNAQEITREVHPSHSTAWLNVWPLVPGSLCPNLHHSRRIPQCLCHRPQSRACRCCRYGRNSADTFH